MTTDDEQREWAETERFVVRVAAVTRLLAEHDPVGIANGDPWAATEYDIEAGQIVRLVQRDGDSDADVLRIVGEVLATYFEGIPLGDLSALADEVRDACTADRTA